MLVNLNQTLTLATNQEEAWRLLRDTKRVAGLIPGVESIAPDQGESGETNGEVTPEKDASVEVMGKLAALGAAPIRRRANELFAQFTERLQGQFSAAGEGSPA